MIRYLSVLDESEGTRIEREESTDGSIVRREAYQFAMPVVVTFETPDQPASVAFTLASQPDAIGHDRTATRQIRAVLGRRLAMQRAEVNP